MQIVVNITENHYKALMKMKEFSLGYYQRAIINGTVLPKGHGDLIDRNEIDFDSSDFYDCDDIIIVEEIIGNAPTIIEADEGE